MNKNIFLLVLFGSLNFHMLFAQHEPVLKHGNLSLRGVQLVDESGKSVELHGMSLFWSQWQPQFYNETTLLHLKNNWGIDIIRAAMGIEHGGYLENPLKEKERIFEVVDAAIKLNLYVIVDWHDHHAQDHTQEAMAFFDELSRKYGNFPNVIYEIYNEPLEVSWSNVIKPYHEKIISVIRENDPDNLIICGTPRWSQKLMEAANDPIHAKNIAYTLHFYAGTHGEELRSEARNAIALGLPVFVSEFGTTEADGDGRVYKEETLQWIQFMHEHQLSWCNWSVADKDEGSAALVPGTNADEVSLKSQLTESGKFVRKLLSQKNKE
ncbi:glycoside hydrolase [Christiangramia fulva]|uniref:Glycoside hydrolase n=1 Tax=Christiangramia fulva TaxID=2126553 RepID=A0A2R3Z2X8_9FLAO|nr:glycoside hydrolase family 5 protein [Christiangramia fulva]AVR44599.1 glycoside hydrolase [Christiangramia fulva]